MEQKEGAQTPKNIHDEFFLSTFSNPHNVREFLLAELPKTLTEAIDFSAIRIETSTHQKASGRKIYSDLVVKAKMKRGDYPADIYILLEHKTRQSQEIFLQLFSYMTAMWRADWKKSEKSGAKRTKYRVIVPLVFYQGKGKWSVPRSFRDLFDVDDEVKEHLLNFSYHLFDINEWGMSDEEKKQFRQHIQLFSALTAMKSAFAEESEWKVQFINLLKFIHETSELFFGDSFNSAVLEYLFRALKLDEESFWDLIKESDVMEEEAMQTVLDVWEQRGMEKGLEQGAYQRAVAIAKEMLGEGLDVALIARVTKLSIEEVLRIKKSLLG